MDGNCNAENVIYQAEVTTSTTKETYIGLCDTTFKLRYRNHICSFRNERYKHATELSKHNYGALKIRKLRIKLNGGKLNKLGPIRMYPRDVTCVHMAGLSYHICGKLKVAFKASPSSQHQHCTDEAQKAETVLSAVSYIYIYIYIYTHIS